MVWFAPEHLHGNHGPLELAIVALEMPFGDELQESAHSLVSHETSARQHPLQLPPCGVKIGTRDGHRSEHTSCFQRCAQCMKHLFNRSVLVRPAIGALENVAPTFPIWRFIST